MAKYTLKRSREHLFFFKHELTQPDLLHIYVRHLTTPADAIQAFFTGTTYWNKTRQRMETTAEHHTVYWFWLEQEAKKVMIITCFKS